MKLTRTKLIVSLALLAVPLALGAASCSSTIPRRNPMGETFPTVGGKSLEGERVALPAALAGAPAVLMIGYKQNTQFDLDRWILGLMQVELSIAIYEVPTIPGLVPGMIAGTINEGMRSGIPLEDWAAVVTLYGEGASEIANWTGTEDGLNGRIVLLDSDGVVVWFHDRGYSAGKLLELEARALELPNDLTD